MLDDQARDPSQLRAIEATASFKANRVQPEFGSKGVALHMNVRRFWPITRVEEEAIRANAEHRGHVPEVGSMAVARQPVR